MGNKKRLPTDVDVMCRCGALLVGSYASYLVGEAKQFNDYDMIVPQELWLPVFAVVPDGTEVTLNRFGGIHYQDRAGNLIDVWPSSIDHHLRTCKPALVVDWIGQRVYRTEALYIS